MGNVRTRRLGAAAVVALVAAADLGQKAAAPTALHHARSGPALALMAVVAIALLALVPQIPSLTVALGAGVAAGGAVGNLVSALVWSAGVPDPLVGGRVAFNLADVFLLAGDALLLCSAVVYALRNRARLWEPV